MSRVTVITGVFNNADTLRRAADSILGQTLTDLELLILDDGSRDESPQVAAAIAAQDERVSLLSMGRNVGISRSLNAAIEAASSPVLAIQDADDHSEPQRLERQLALLDARPDVAVVGARMHETDGDGRPLRPRTTFAAGEVNELLMRFNPIPNSVAAFRRDAALEVGGYDPRYRYAMDYDLWLRIAERHVVYALDETLATRVMSGVNVAARRERAQIGETLSMRARALRRRQSLHGAGGLLPAAVSYVTPLPLKRAVRRRVGQAP